jgi:DNA-binding transcriptional LysR family regulator
MPFCTRTDAACASPGHAWDGTPDIPPLSIPLNTMELRHLRYFISVAESESLRVAAERIHVTQPAITRQIHDLEAELGVQLFERSHLGMKLTPAGTLFLREVRIALDILSSAARSAGRVAAGLEGSLCIGFVENASWDGVVPETFNHFQQIAPEVSLQLAALNTPEQFAGMMSDRIDGGFIYRFGKQPKGISTIPVANHDVVLAVPSRWPLSAEPSVAARNLNGKPFICFPRQTYPEYFDHLIGSCDAAGLTLNVVQEASTEAAILSLVSAGIGAAIVNSANRGRPPALVRFIPLSDLSIPLPLQFAYRESNANPALARFRELLGPGSA